MVENLFNRMQEVQPDCKICKGGCCDGDVKLFGFIRSDLIHLAQFNLVMAYPPGSYADLNTLYSHLRDVRAPDGFYTLQNDPFGNDIDGVRIGNCNACVEGLCLLQSNKPRPCVTMEVAGRLCMTIFLGRTV